MFASVSLMEMFLSCIVLSGDRPYLIDRLFDGKKITPRPTIGTRCKACRGTTQISALYQNDDNKANTSLADNGAYRVPLTRPHRRFTGQAPKGNAHILLHVRSQPYGLSVVQISKCGNFIIATSTIISYFFYFARGNCKKYQIFSRPVHPYCQKKKRKTKNSFTNVKRSAIMGLRHNYIHSFTLQ